MWRMNVEGRIGNIDTGFSLETPSRQFDFMVSGSEAQLTLDGRANDMAALLGLPTQYRAVHEGRMELTHNVLAAPTGQLKLGLVLDKDVLDISGTMRPEGESRRLDGQMAFQLANFRPFFSTEKPIGEKNAFIRCSANCRVRYAVQFFQFRGAKRQWSICRRGRVAACRYQTGLARAHN